MTDEPKAGERPVDVGPGSAWQREAEENGRRSASNAPVEKAGEGRCECGRWVGTVSALRAEVERLKRDAARHEEEEAANCPEDQSCIETIKALRAELAAAREEVAENGALCVKLAAEKARGDKAKAEVERLIEKERMVDAAISVLSLSNTEKTLAENHLPRENPYWTPTQDDVARAIRREMWERDRADKAEQRVRELLSALEEDAAGVEMTQTMRTAAEMIEEYVGGPVVDRLTLAASAIHDAILRAREQKEKSEESAHCLPSCKPPYHSMLCDNEGQEPVEVRLCAWAQNEEMIDSSYTQHGKDCLEANTLILALRAEVERLKAEGAQWKDLHDSCHPSQERLRAELAQAREEIERRGKLVLEAGGRENGLRADLQLAKEEIAAKEEVIRGILTNGKEAAGSYAMLYTRWEVEKAARERAESRVRELEDALADYALAFDGLTKADEMGLSDAAAEFAAQEASRHDAILGDARAILAARKKGESK